MQKMFPNFNYDKYETTGQVKPIAKLYLKLFQSLNLSAKSEDLKRAYATNKHLHVTNSR